VENIGIITLGLGIGLIGMSTASPMLIVLGFGGGLFHLLNHAFIKGLLFLGAGAIAHATGTRDLNQLGGLLKPMPWTGATFLLGAVAITGLPPLNGFISEFLIYLGALHGLQSFGGVTAVTLLGVIVGLSLIGGLAAACFAKAFGSAFLGEARTSLEVQAHEPGGLMLAPLLLLAAGCVFIGFFAPTLLSILAPVLQSLTHLPATMIHPVLMQTSATLSFLVFAAFLLISLIALLIGVRHWLLTGRTVTQEVTWDCGYAQPTPRMQYTASSFVQPLTERLAALIRPQRKFSPPQGFFPVDASLSTETSDLSRRYFFQPFFRNVGLGLASLRWLQQGQMQLYVLYIALTLLALLVWRLG
jgi:NADH:ubiquinone oxidoreductase subunit 5 (subunit L)/multisubunit Na+/H+ antiporter MnhA subunit